MPVADQQSKQVCVLFYPRFSFSHPIIPVMGKNTYKIGYIFVKFFEFFCFLRYMRMWSLSAWSSRRNWKGTYKGLSVARFDASN